MKNYYKLYFLLLVGGFGIIGCSKKSSVPKKVEVSFYGGNTKYNSLLYVDSIKYDYLTPLPYDPPCDDASLIKVLLTVGKHACWAPNNSGYASDTYMEFTVTGKECQIIHVIDRSDK